MPNVILFNMVTLDGFFEGANGDIDWHKVDEEFNDFSIEQLDTVGGLLFGRVTYQMMAGYWPTPAAMQTDPEVTEKMNTIPKIVFSRTLDKAEWNNTTLARDAAGEVAKLKQQPGKDLFIFGSADLASSLIQQGLVDEFRIMVNPVVLGSGRPLFKDIRDKLDLKLLKSRAFGNGNVLLYYQTMR